MYIIKKLLSKHGEIDACLLWILFTVIAVLVLAFSVYQLPNMI
ncbi:hypothetical protein [Methanococcus vannielii]|nr:hypothetical protein [Methanococcus vannielii]